MLTTPPEDHAGFFQNWGMLQWIFSATWTVGGAIAGFVWKLSMRVDELSKRQDVHEQEAKIRSEADSRRHEENVHVLRGIQQQNTGMIVRIDDIYKNLLVILKDSKP